MRLLSIKVKGKFKGLRDQVFNFDSADGNIIALIGLNGSGKSQLLELIAETFGYIERSLREDFRTRDWSEDLSIALQYENEIFDSENVSRTYSITIATNGHVGIHMDGKFLAYRTPQYEGIIKEILPSQVIGYSSGLNENLQRAFMKNAVQYLDVMNAKRSWRKRLTDINEKYYSEGSSYTEANIQKHYDETYLAYRYYRKRYKGVFPVFDKLSDLVDQFDDGIRPTELPRLRYFNHDTTALMMASIGMMKETEQVSVWRGKQRFSQVKSVKIFYDLRGISHDLAAVEDISRLVKLVGGSDSEFFSSLSGLTKTSEEFYDRFELDYLAGHITIDYGYHRVAIREHYSEPRVLFDRLYRLQLLSAQYWMGGTRKCLRSDRFWGSVKVPQKWKSPIQVTSLKLSGEDGLIEFDDLSDGEAQLIQILSMAYIYRDSRTLFLLDEPETHLNPSWRTHFHSYLSHVVPESDTQSQFFISTHSPFMISSLKRENVYKFSRDSDGMIAMGMAQNNTYGASFDVLIKDLFELKSLISHSVIDEIREQLKQSDDHAREWIEANLGLSAEKAYLIRKLSQ